MTEETQVEQPTAEEVQRHFDAAMDSVHLLEAGEPENMTDVEWADCKKRNVEHLEIMVAKTWWNGQDLSPLQAAISANQG
jgi:hypothetical protein